MTTYSEQVIALKALRKQGIEVSVPLNSNKSTIQREYDRLVLGVEPEMVATTEFSPLKEDVRIRESASAESLLPQCTPKIKILEFVPNDAVVLGIAGEYREIPLRWSKSGEFGQSLRTEIGFSSIATAEKFIPSKINISKYSDGYIALPENGVNGGEVKWLRPRPDTIRTRVNAKLNLHDVNSKIVWLSPDNQTETRLDGSDFVCCQVIPIPNTNLHTRHICKASLTLLKNTWLVIGGSYDMRWLHDVQKQHFRLLDKTHKCTLQRDWFVANPSQWIITEITYQGVVAMAHIKCVHPGSGHKVGEFKVLPFVELHPLPVEPFGSYANG